MTSAISKRVTSLSGRDGVAILGPSLAIDETGGEDGAASPPYLATEGAIPLSARGRPPIALLRQHSTQLVQTVGIGARGSCPRCSTLRARRHQRWCALSFYLL